MSTVLVRADTAGPRTILTINIQKGGGLRVPGILAYLGDQDADLVCLTEFQNGPKARHFIEGLAAVGYSFHCATDVPSGSNTVALFSKFPLVPDGYEVPATFSRHLLLAQVGDLLTIGVYFPQGKSKVPVFNWLLDDRSSVWLQGRAIMLGDFNTCLNGGLDAQGAPFACANLFQALQDRGWRDSFRELHPTTYAYSWISNRGKGFRVDHALLSPGLGLDKADYDDATRSKDQRITDHSCLLLSLRQPGVLGGTAHV